jgi:hypothetical protein
MDIFRIQCTCYSPEKLMIAHSVSQNQKFPKSLVSNSSLICELVNALALNTSSYGK